MNEQPGSRIIRHTTAMLLIMAMQDDRKEDETRFENLTLILESEQQYLHMNRFVNGSLASSAQVRWLRDLLPNVDSEVYKNVRSLLNGNTNVPNHPSLNKQYLEDTVLRISGLFRVLSNMHDATASPQTETAFWPPDCYPHPGSWRLRQVVGDLLA